MDSPAPDVRFPGRHLHAARAARKGGAENVDFDRTVPAKKNDSQGLPFLTFAGQRTAPPARPQTAGPLPCFHGPAATAVPLADSWLRLSKRRRAEKRVSFYRRVCPRRIRRGGEADQTSRFRPVSRSKTWATFPPKVNGRALPVAGIGCPAPWRSMVWRMTMVSRPQASTWR